MSVLSILTVESTMSGFHGPVGSSAASAWGPEPSQRRGIQGANNFNNVGRKGVNPFGSRPAFITDEAGVPANFRMFDTHMGLNQVNQASFPNPELVEKVFSTAEGESSWAHAVRGDNYAVLSLPVLAQVASMGGIAAYCHMQMKARPLKQLKFEVIPYFVLSWAWYNGYKWYGREKNFLKDFERNQQYGQVELIQQRNKQRAREALYASQFAPMDPVMEYRLKEWQLSKRWN